MADNISENISMSEFNADTASPTTNRSTATLKEPAEGSKTAASNEEANQAEADAASTAAASAAKDAKDKQSSKANYKVTFLHFLRIFSYTTTYDKLLLVAASLASICVGITLPLMNIVFGRMVSAFSGFYMSYYTGEGPEQFKKIIDDNVLYMVYLFIGRLFLDYIAILGFRMLALRISSKIRLVYIKSLFTLPISVLDVLPPGQTASIITTSSSLLQSGLSPLSSLLSSISLIITAIIISFLYSASLTLVTCSGLLFICIVYGISIPLYMKGMKEVEHAERQASSVASEGLVGVRMVKACGAEQKMRKRFEGWVEEGRRRGVGMSKLIALQQAPVFFAVYGTFALSFWWAIRLYMRLEITSVQTLIVVLMSVMTIVTTVSSIAAPLAGLSRAAGAASVFFSIIDATKPVISGRTDVRADDDIVLWNVNFFYPTRPDVKILDDLCIRFPKGKSTAIIGASGSGKSTIVALIERWYELDAERDGFNNIFTPWIVRNGYIGVGKTKLHEIDLKYWRSQIGLVQQEPFLFHDTILKNVEYGLIGTEWENASDEVKRGLAEQACKEAFADEFIVQLPEGYGTQVGDGGLKLSGGQRQRIAIARSVVKQPKILILDEATSAIDVRSEQIVQAALDKVSEGRTTITIAHRLSTIKKADKIIVLHKGKVVEQGKHQSLIEYKDGVYWKLVNAQSLNMAQEDEKTKGLLAAVVDDGEAFRGASTETLINEEEDLEVGNQVLQKEPEEPVFEPRGFLKSFGLLMYEQRSQWPWFAVMSIGVVFVGASYPFQAYLFAHLISVFDYWGKYLQTSTNFWCTMFVVLAGAVGIGHFMLGWTSNHVSYHVTSTYRREYFSNVLSKPIAFFDGKDNSVGALTARISNDPTQLQQLLGVNLAFMLISVFNVIGCMTVSFYFGWKLAAATFGSSIPIVLAAGYFRIQFETAFEKMNNNVFAESSKFATESIGAIRTVTALTMEGTIVARYEKLLEDNLKNVFQKAKYSTLVFAMSDSISLLCMAFALWYGGQLLAAYQYAPFNFLVVYLAVVQGSLGAGQWLNFGPNIAQASAAANRIQSLRTRKEDNAKTNAVTFGQKNELRNGIKIELQNVFFKYPTRDIPVLKGLSLTIEQGQFAAIIGPSGSGKTSIISLLERFYQVQSGAILFNGQDISKIDLGPYRNLLSLVAQEPTLFDGTIRENILLGVDEENTPDVAVHEACQAAELHDFICSLPDSYDTKVGARGLALSGGQKQRIAIARALIRDPKVLLLDEATSNLDSETEKQVQAVFERTGKGRTMVVVAHRLATVQNADVIFVVGDGKVLESGNHASLLRRKGVYYQMCQSQELDK